jgi:hypothetical protein
VGLLHRLLNFIELIVLTISVTTLPPTLVSDRLCYDKYYLQSSSSPLITPLILSQ